MKSTAPWSIKGIDPDAREAAKKAARAAGMTLGEWLNQQILLQSPEGAADRPAAQPITASPITLDHLRELVASLNRLNDRLQNNEKNSREAISGLNQGLTSALERIREMERQRATGSNDALIGRIEKIEAGGINRESIDGLKALEKALSQTLHQFEEIREETLTRVEANETAIEGLTERVDVMDSQLREAIIALHENVEEVNGQISITERTVAMVLKEAREAAQSDDEEFIERTSNKMRILGNEIKRTSDRIQGLDDKIARLAEQIDASEQRSADGISQISKTVAALSTELAAYDESQGSAMHEAREAIESASQDADDRLTTLKRSFDTMLMRIEGIADGEKAGQAALAAAPPAQTVSPVDAEEAESEAQPPLPAAGDLPSLDAPQDLLEDAPEDAIGDMPPVIADTGTDDEDETGVPSEEDFDAIFGEPLGRETDPFFDEDLPELTPDGSRLKEPDFPDTDDHRPAMAKPDEALSPKQKVILAARARRKRMDQGVERDDLRAEALGGTATARADTDTGSGESTLDRLRRKYSPENGKGGGLPLIPLVLIAAIVVIMLGYILFKDTLRDNVSSLERDSSAQTTPTVPAGPAPDTPQARYAAALETLSTAQSREERAPGIAALREAAGQGYAPAQFQLAEMARNGRFIPLDPAEARRLYALAAEGGNIAAMHKLGTMYMAGEGGEKDDYTALSWYEQAATYGYLNSIYNLGLLYDPAVELEIEDGIINSAAQSYYWYSLAARLGDEAAAGDAQNVGQTLDPDQRQQIDNEVAAWSAQPPIRSANPGL